MRTTPPPPRHPSAFPRRRCRTARPSGRGAAALAVTLTMFFVMALVSVFVNRSLIFEQRIAANQYRSTLAFEAAEAGLQWAEAQLNGNQRLDARCRPSTDPASDSFRERYLQWTAATGALTPRVGGAPGAAVALRPVCVRAAAGWACSCGSDGAAPVPTAPAGAVTAPAFSLQFQASGKPGIVRLVTTGCSSLAPPCTGGSDGASAAEAQARVEVLLGLLGGIRSAPAAALTTAGPVEAPTAAFTATNRDAATGIVLHAGAAIVAPLARLAGPPGAAAGGLQVAGDTALAGLGPDGLFASYFGMGKARWQDQPTVTRVVCSSDCAGAVAQAVAERAGSAMVWIDGDATLAGPVRLGSPERPVVIVVDGTLQLQSDVDVSGVVYAGRIGWDGAGTPAGGPSAGAGVRGATISEDAYRGTAAPLFAYDAEVLARLSGFAGSFVRVSGSWRDF